MLQLTGMAASIRDKNHSFTVAMYMDNGNSVTPTTVSDLQNECYQNISSKVAENLLVLIGRFKRNGFLIASILLHLYSFMELPFHFYHLYLFSNPSLHHHISYSDLLNA